MEYTSIEQIKIEFGFEFRDVNQAKELLNDLKKQTHPNNTKGDFANEEQKTKYFKALAALDYLNSLNNDNQLIVVEKMTDLIKVMITDVLVTKKDLSLEQSLDNKITFALTNYRPKSFGPKISLTAITAILTFIFLFPGQIKDNPTISRFINPTNPFFGILWLTCLFYTGFFWWLTYRQDEAAKRSLSLLKVDSTQNAIFHDFISVNSVFTKDDLTNFIFETSSRRRHSNLLNIFGSEIINLEIAQNTAELIIARAEKKNVIRKTADGGLSDKFEVIIV